MGSSRGPFSRVIYVTRSQWCHLILVASKITDRYLFNKLSMQKKENTNALHYLPFVVEMHRSMMTSSNGNIFRVTGHLCGEFTGLRWIPRTKASDAELLMFSLICTRINGWINNREAGDLRHHRSHCDVIVTQRWIPYTKGQLHVQCARVMTSTLLFLIQGPISLTIFHRNGKFILLSSKFCEVIAVKSAHGATAVLSWHVQNFIAIRYLTMELHENQYAIEFDVRWKNRSWNGLPNPQCLENT